MGSESQHPNQLTHVLMISFPSQGHINPLLRLGKKIASKGLLVTFSTTEDMGRAIRSSNDTVTDQPIPVGDGYIRFEFFDDEWTSNDSRFKDLDAYLLHLEAVGRRRVPDIMARLAQEGRPVSCLINNPFIPWVSDVAEELGLPSAMLWVQSCACFLAYYYYHHSLTPFPTETAPELSVEIPTLPSLKWDEIPTFLHPNSPYPFLKRAILGQYNNLSKPFCVLADTFTELEAETVAFTNKTFPIRPVGPLFKEINARPGAVQVRADPIKADFECLRWLDRQPAGSVIYISFGTVVFIRQEQVDELAAGIEQAGVSFLWVMKPPQQQIPGLEPSKMPDGFMDRVGDRGKVVSFAPQEQVLEHPAIACFMTHCGWNSTIEALTSGVPVVAFPQWGDQVTDAKFLCDVFGVGVQLCRGEHDKVIPRDEVEKCFREVVSGPKATEMKKNALKWKVTAEGAVTEGGSSDQNLQYFVDEVRKRSKTVLANVDKFNNLSIEEANGN